MRLRLACGHEELLIEVPDGAPVTVVRLLRAIGEQRPDLYQRWCDQEGKLRTSLAVFVDGEHIRYRKGLETELCEDNEVYVIPLITGG